jgi:hypothetical protein
MMHTVHLDENVKVRKLPKSSYYHRQTLSIENVSKASNNNVPAGYISGEDFRKRSIEKVNKFCDKHGIL